MSPLALDIAHLFAGSLVVVSAGLTPVVAVVVPVPPDPVTSNSKVSRTTWPSADTMRKATE